MIHLLYIFIISILLVEIYSLKKDKRKLEKNILDIFSKTCEVVSRMLDVIGNVEDDNDPANSWKK